MKVSQFNRKLHIFLFLLILFFAAVIRFYGLGDNPSSLDWDEASLGYNAYSLLLTGKDEFGRSWPISIRSFEDYKPALYTYLTIGPVALFGLTEFAVRLPSAITGWLTVLVSFFLFRKLFNVRIGLLVAFLLTISPWHIQFSRVAFEANVALLFVTSGAYFFYKSLDKPRWLFVSIAAFVLSFYSYHSPRLVVPVLLIGWGWIYRLRLWKMRRFVVFSCLFGLLLLIPFFKELLTSGRARFSSVTVLTPEGRLDRSIKLIESDQKTNDQIGIIFHNRRVIYFHEIIKGYLNHFNLDFLFLTGDAPGRHHARDMGMLYWWEFPFIVLGILFLIKKRHYPMLWWFFVAPIASSITTGTPHAVRALMYLPVYTLISALGIRQSLDLFKRQHFSGILKIIICTVIGGAMIVSVFVYFESYYVHTPIESAPEWQYGYKEVIAQINRFEGEVDTVIMTYAYDQPHIFVLFYNRVDPVWYQSLWKGDVVLRAERTFGKYIFRKIDWNKDKNLQNTLIVGSPTEIPEASIGHVKDVLFPDGTVAFRVVKL